MAYQKLAQALNDSVKMYTPDVLYPRECLIVDVNEDDTLKIIVNIGENIYLDEVRYIGIPKTNTTGLFIPLNNNYDEGYCICYNETTESLTENVIINNINSSTTEKVNEVNESEEETSEEITNEVSEETQANINYDRRYAKINHTHTENVGTIEDLKTLIKNTKEGNILSLNQNFKNERYGNIIINKSITIDGNGHSIENISFTCDANEIELNNITFFNVTTNRVNGGVLQLNGQRISINNCIFYNNIINGTSVYEGGAISVNSSSIETKITDCYFIDNFCSNNGGAIRWIANDGVLIGCKFIGNTATNSGGAIKWLGTDGFIRNCLFKDNKATNGKDILTSDNELLCIGNVFLNDDTIIGTERVYDYITEFDKEEIEHQIYSSFGRNLLPNTKHMILANRNITVQYADETFRNNKVVYFDDETVSSNGYRDWYYDISVGEFNYDDEFTLSFWVKSTENVFDKVKVYFNGGSNYIKEKVIDTNGYDYVDEFNDGKTSFEIDTDWKKCYVTWKINSTGNLNVYKRLIIRIYDGVEVFLSSPKLERGNVYTDWTPNPNDSLYDRIPINASASNPNIDLNNYIESGVYYQPNNNNSQYVTNKPTNDNLAFSLFVEKQTDNGVKQTLTYYDYPKTSRMFVRIKHYSSDNWTKWERIQFTGMNEGGANLLNVGGYYQSGGNEVQDGITHNGHKSVYINNLDKTSSQYTHIYWLLPNGFHNYDEIYTLSFWAKCSDDNSVDKYITTYFAGESGYVTVKRIDSNSTVNTTQGSFNDGRTDFKLSKEWQHFYVVYQLNSSGDLTVRKQPIIRVWGESEAYISSPKLERGYNVSDWTPSVLNAEVIYPNMDLNDFTMKGEYRCPLTAWAKKISNVPINLEVAFNLKVEPTTDNGCVQTFSAYLPYKTIICKRSMYNNDWSSWDTSVTEPRIVCLCDGSSGDGYYLGYAKAFKIFINSTYFNAPLSFEINRRVDCRPIKCYLRFNYENNKNPTIKYFTYDGEDIDIYICNEEQYYYTIYIKKLEMDDYIEVKNFNFNESFTVNTQRMRIIPLNDQIPKADLPYQLSTNYNSGQNDKKAVNVVKIESNNDITLSNNLTVNGDISSGNIITKLSTSSTNQEIPSAKSVYRSFTEKIDSDDIIIYESDMTVKDNNWIQSGGNLTVTYNGNGCSVLGTELNDGFYKLNLEMPYNFICEFDIISMTQGNYNVSTDFIVGNIDIRLHNNSFTIGQLEGGIDYSSVLPNYPIHIKVEYISTEAKVYVNGDVVGTWEKSYSYIGFKTYLNRDITIKNLKIYRSDDDWNVNTILNNDLYVGTLRQGRIKDSNVTITNNELNFTTTHLYDTYWFMQNYIFSKYDEWNLSFNIRKPAGSFPGTDFGIVIGDENNHIDLFMGYYDIVISVNETKLSRRSGGANATSDTPIKISRKGDNWEFDYNNGEYVANVSTDGYDIPNKFIVEEMNWSVNGSIFINNVVFNSTHKNFSLFDLIYPVGAIYMSVNDINPNVLFGGRWEQLKDRFLLGSGDVYENGSTGGEATHTLTVNEMPSHRHSRMTQPQGFAERDTKKSDIISPASGTANKVTKYSDYTGGGQAHNNMPPYFVVYMWKRIG